MAIVDIAAINIGVQVSRRFIASASETAPHPIGQGLRPTRPPPTIDASPIEQVPRFPTAQSEKATNWRFPRPSHRGDDHLLEQLKEFRGRNTFTPREEGKSGQVKTTPRGGPGGSRAQAHLCPRTWVAALSWNIEVFILLEAPKPH